MALQVAARSNRDALYLVDSSIYVFKAWHVYPEVVDAEGKPANAAIGFTEFLHQLLTRRTPKQIVCAFDESHGQSVRHQIYPLYKANRPPAPQELKHQFSLCKSFVSAAGIAALASNDVEADDIIGTLAFNARDKSDASVIVSADKDLCQFVGFDDAIWDYTKDVWLDARLVEKKFGVRPNQIPDLLALTGDKVDNIPGIPGVGVTTAARLLVKWGNLDALFDNLANVSAMKFRGAPHVATLLDSHKDTVMLSRKLTGLHHFPIPADLSLEIEPDAHKLDEIFHRLAFSPTKQRQWRRTLQC